MKQNTEKFNGVDGCQLYYKSWEPEETLKAKLIIVHGAGEHIDRYENLVNALPESGYVVVGYDQRGHGRSEGQRGHINSWDEYRGDLEVFIDEVNQMYPEIPVFVLGHSLGSLIVLDYIIHQTEGIKGAIISGTALAPKDAAPPFLAAPTGKAAKLPSPTAEPAAARINPILDENCPLSAAKIFSYPNIVL